MDGGRDDEGKINKIRVPVVVEIDKRSSARVTRISRWQFSATSWEDKRMRETRVDSLYTISRLKDPLWRLLYSFYTQWDCFSVRSFAV